MCTSGCPLGANHDAASSSGAPGMNRTCDLRFRKPLLYPLSYGSGDGAKWGAKFADTRRVISKEVTGVRSEKS